VPIHGPGNQFFILPNFSSSGFEALCWQGERGSCLGVPTHPARKGPKASPFFIGGKEMNPGLFIGMAALFALVFFGEYFFGPKDIDDRQGFPWSRKRRKKK
jgi:hypothetical protein